MFFGQSSICLPPDADNKGELGLRLHKEVARILGCAPGTDELTLLRPILLYVLLGLLEYHLPLRFGSLSVMEDFSF